MKNLFKTLILIVFAFILIGCSKTVEYTVMFETNTEATIEKVNVKKGETLTLPAAPEKEGYVFDGWYLKEEKFDESTKVTNDMILTAHWSLDETLITSKDLRIGETYTLVAKNTNYFWLNSYNSNIFVIKDVSDTRKTIRCTDAANTSEVYQVSFYSKANQTTTVDFKCPQ